MKNVSAKLEHYKGAIAKLLNNRSALKQQFATEKANLQKAKNRLADIGQAQVITQRVAQHVQQKAHKQIAAVVTTCLQTVFGNGYSFAIQFERKRGRTEAVLTLLKDGREMRDPLNEDSGGVAEVAAFALRVVCVCMAKPRVRKVLILDEPFKSVHSPVYRENVRAMLEQLANDFGLQIIMVTGVEEYKTGKIIEM